MGAGVTATASGPWAGLTAGIGIPVGIPTGGSCDTPPTGSSWSELECSRRPRTGGTVPAGRTLPSRFTPARSCPPFITTHWPVSRVAQPLQHEHETPVGENAPMCLGRLKT